MLMKGESMDPSEQSKPVLPARGHSLTDRLANSTKVESVAQEYEIVNRKHCDCGGTLAPTSQSLLVYDNGHYDLIETQCEACHKSRDFIFDIGDWFAEDEV